MARTSWFDERAEHPVIQEQLSKLDSFTSAMADGVVEKRELDAQEQRLRCRLRHRVPPWSRCDARRAQLGRRRS